MYSKIVHFIKYHNAFSIIFVMVFSGLGISYAASPAVRESVYSSEETVVSVDNSRVVLADLDSFNFNLRINSITEDEAYYYVAYSYQTLAVENSVWQNTGVEKTLKVSKEALGGKDLGLYVTEELGENIRSEQHYLKRVQKLEKGKGASKKVVAVEYSGLIGRFLDPKEKVIERPEAVTAEPNGSGNNPIFVHENSTSQPISSPTSTPVNQPGASVETTPLTSPTPELTPASSSVTPIPNETPTPTPESTSTPTPELTSIPEITPTPTPSDTPIPTPSDTPIPIPVDTPTPTPTPPEPTPTPEPIPSPTPESTPEPTPETVNE